MSVALIALIVLWWGLILYAVLGGADFGAEVWDLFAIGKRAEQEHDFINHALGPVWEANHVWLIFLIVGLLNIFPTAFAALTTALFVPLSKTYPNMDSHIWCSVPASMQTASMSLVLHLLHRRTFPRNSRYS